MSSIVHRCALGGLLLTLPGCSWLWGGEEESGASEDQVAALRREVATLRAELASMREETDVAHDVLETTAADERQAAQRADFDELEAVVEDNADLADDIDVDLGRVESDIDALLQRMALAESKVDSLESVINNHADGIDALSADLSLLESETASLRPLNDLLYLDDGKIFVDGVDMVFNPTEVDGQVRQTGPVMPTYPVNR